MNSDIMSVNINNLKQKQHDFIKKHTLDILAQVVANIKSGDYVGAQEYLESSPSGDGYGCDNEYIDFTWEGAPDLPDGYDIGTMLGYLMELSK